MAAYVITEGKLDAEFLRRVLPVDLLEGVEFVAAGSLSNIKSMARSLLVRRRTPVAVVIDADTLDEALIQERRQSTEEVIRIVAGKVPIRVILAVPELEALLFQDPAILKRVIGQPIPDSVLLLAQISPRKAIEELCAISERVRSRAELLRSLTPPDLEILRKAELVQELSEFLRHAREFSLASAGAPATA